MTSPDAPSSLGVLEVKAPCFSEADAEATVREVFRLEAEARALYSERDQNFHLRASDGREFVLKVANPAEDPTVVDFQTRALLHIAAVDTSLPVPQVVPAADGEPYRWVVGPDGRRSLVRLLTFLPGRLLDHTPPTPELLCDIGATAARLARALRVSAQLKARLQALAERHALIGDVRGSGLIVGVELVRDRESLEPAAQEAHAVMNHMREDGVLVGLSGTHGNVLKIRPPLAFSEADAERLAEALDRALGALA